MLETLEVNAYTGGDPRRGYYQQVATRAQVHALGPTVELYADTGLFQDAAMTIPAVANGDPVGGWQDQSGNALDLTQTTTAAKPTLQLAGFGGLAAPFFTADDYLTCTLPGIAAAWSGNDRPATMVALYRPSQSPPPSRCLWSLGNTASALPTFYLRTLNPPSLTVERRGDTGGFATLSTPSGGADAGASYITALSFPGTAATIYVNNAPTAGPLDADAATFNVLALGARVRTSVDLLFSGYFRAFLGFARALTAAELAVVTGYLAGFGRVGAALQYTTLR